MKGRLAAVGLASLLFAFGCTGVTLFEELGSHLAAPIAVAVDTANARAYVVNSNNRQEFDGASLTVLDITDPVNPTALNSAVNPIPIENFSGQITLDLATRTAFLANRFSESSVATNDTLLRINLDEAGASFGTVDSFASAGNPFGVACCDSAGRLYVVSNNGAVDVYNPADPSTYTEISLALTLSTGEPVSGRNATEVALLGDQAFVTNRAGRTFVLNTTEVGNTALNPIDYIILNGGDLRGIATDGTLLYVVDATEDDTLGTPILRVLDPASLTAVSPDSPAPTEIDIATLQTAAVALGDDPYEIVLFGGRAYVSNRGSDTVSVIDLATNAAAATITVGDEPFGLAAFTAGGSDSLYVTNLAGNSVSIVDLASNSVVGTFAP